MSGMSDLTPDLSVEDLVTKLFFMKAMKNLNEGLACSRIPYSAVLWKRKRNALRFRNLLRNRILI